jgi:hypothetical protein
LLIEYTTFLPSGSENISLQSIHLSEYYANLDQQTQHIINSLHRHGAGIEAEVREQTLALTQLVNRLESVNQDEHRRTRAMIINAVDPNGDGNGGVVAANIEMFSVPQQEDSRQRVQVQTKILHDLKYSAMTHRYEEVLEAYQQTFDWVFQPSTPEQLPWSNFVEWLKNSGGVYWMNGKAGSGKSTLMKHIYNEPRTHQYFRTWAGELPLCSATFFFWNSGNPEQLKLAFSGL